MTTMVTRCGFTFGLPCEEPARWAVFGDGSCAQLELRTGRRVVAAVRCDLHLPSWNRRALRVTHEVDPIWYAAAPIGPTTRSRRARTLREP